MNISLSPQMPQPVSLWPLSPPIRPGSNSAARAPRSSSSPQFQNHYPIGCCAHGKGSRSVPIRPGMVIGAALPCPRRQDFFRFPWPVKCIRLWNRIPHFHRPLLHRAAFQRLFFPLSCLASTGSQETSAFRLLPLPPFCFCAGEGSSRVPKRSGTEIGAAYPLLPHP